MGNSFPVYDLAGSTSVDELKINTEIAMEKLVYLIC